MSWVSNPLKGVGAMDDEPHARHDDGLCIDGLCPREAVMDGGVRVAHCAEHLDQWRKMYGHETWFAADIARRPLVVHSALLSLRERAWLPQNWHEASAEWPNVTTVEAFGGCFVHQLDGGDDEWTWRSVAVAARAFPDRPIRLVGSALYIPQVPPRSAGT